jgi:2,4-dienoyl-CoA reductase-like NADH-dependent reductase (Old Yellow Enzyme family)/thioredoxin reductase
MSLIQRLMGRRQFLISAGLASGCALTCKKLAGFQTNVAMAADQAATSGVKAATNRCPHLLSPLKIRNVVLKNRIMHTQSPPHCLQGPENFPAEAYRNHYSNMAKNAAIVSLGTNFGTYPIKYSTPAKGSDHHSDHIWEDIPPVYNYIQRMIDDIHCEGSLVYYVGSIGGGSSGGKGGGAPAGAGGAGGAAPGGAQSGGAAGGGTAQGGAAPQAQGSGGQGAPGGAPSGGSAQGGVSQGRTPPGGAASGGAAQGGMQRQQQTVSVKDTVAQAKKIEDDGYDVIGLMGNNIELVEAVRNSTNLILIAKLSVGGGMSMKGEDFSKYKWNYPNIEYDWQFGSRTPGIDNTHVPTADEIEQAVVNAKKLDGMADIFWIRDGRVEHPNGYYQHRETPFNLPYARAIKAAGVKTYVCPSAGFHLAEQNDQFIASGQTDMVGMTTPFFADAEYIRKAYEGRFEDIVPCLMCQDCHGTGRGGIGPFYSTCTVNPKWGTPGYKVQNIPAPTTKKRVAVIGGGPGGMKAAMVAADRGHKVTLYEKNSSLGGLLQFTDYSEWKWPYKDYKDYLINQMKKQGIEVKLNTAATPEMIKAKGYGTVLVATGAEVVGSRMAEADGKNVFDILTCHSNKNALGKNVVFIGAGRIGTEAAIGIAKDGHKITQISSTSQLIEPEVIGPHNMMNQISILQNHPDYSCVLNAIVKGISGGRVTYTDEKGQEKSIQADSVVIYSGLKPRTDEAMKFQGSAYQVLLLGDCTGKNGNIQKTIRNAFFVASQV